MKVAMAQADKMIAMHDASNGKLEQKIDASCTREEALCQTGWKLGKLAKSLSSIEANTGKRSRFLHPSKPEPNVSSFHFTAIR